MDFVHRSPCSQSRFNGTFSLCVFLGLHICYTIQFNACINNGNTVIIKNKFTPLFSQKKDIKIFS